MRIGLQVPSFTWPGGQEAIHRTLAEIARTADEAGFYSLWVMDHFFQIRGVGQIDEPMLEAYTTLGYLAALTTRMKLGALVTAVAYRHPGALIKQVTTLDVLSNGRAYFGIGAAWFEGEAEALGLPFPPVAERFERLEETLQIAQKMWSGDESGFEGRHYRLTRTLNVPQAISQPHPPILIGGSGERKTLRLVARYADACNLFVGSGLDVVRRKLDVLREHCREIGRSYDSIEKTTLGTVDLSEGRMSAADVIELCRKLADLGIEHAIFNMPTVHEITPLHVFGEEIIPAVEGM
ncbi:MAG TPA: LLM class F420-dependent oxidoreductase [Aggregatilineales bacterium]|nr:LLM class F420-dependent oxidoreductase [Aggregatilineales bacterium]HPV06205.1 LLM class F420-dependent oxidoreductase [Aggregatilineales bacterium]HQA69278.1 LLM class F420-dependent oxidoreductase [Aggregatilineales bacterium]